ncbi:MAG TPA: enoyl-CoA hydratase-related protein [Solirubrobacteraceae bacterium]|nr:enoyl-CoA hydratase-related protein [Solirubrobacteraceae bacterium]
MSSTADGGTPDGGRLLVDEPAPGVARLTISNPGKRGALDHAILDAFVATLRSIDARCVLVTGEEEIFSAGYDIGNLDSETRETVAEEASRLVAQPFAEALEALAGYRYPTVAALNGHAIGGGLELAVSCDLRLAASTISLGMPPAKLGLVYSHTGIRTFVDTIGAARTRELFLVGNRIDARTALDWGLVNRVVSFDELAATAVALAAEIAANAPLAQAGNKRVIAAVVDGRAALPPAVERELEELRLASFASEDFREGLRAFAEKRAPRWRGR